MAPMSHPTIIESSSASTGFALTNFESIPTIRPDPFRPDVNAHLTLFEETESNMPTRKDFPRITFAMSNLGAPPLLPTTIISTDVQPAQTATTSPYSSSTTTTTTTSASNLFTTSSPASVTSSKATTSSTSDHGLYRVASTTSYSHSSQAAPSTSETSSTDVSRTITPSDHPNVPAILLGCLLVFVMLTLIGSSLSWCFFSKSQRRRRQQEQFWGHDEEQIGIDSPSFNQTFHKSTVGQGQWNRPGEEDMAEVSLGSPILNRRGPGYRSPVLASSAGTEPNPIISTVPTPSPLLPQATTTSMATTAAVERPHTLSIPSVQDHSAQSAVKKLVVVNSAPGDVSSSDSESLIGPRKADGEITYSRRWKLS